MPAASKTPRASGASPDQLAAWLATAGPDTGESLAETEARMAGGIASPAGTDPREIVAALRARRARERGPQKAPTLARVGLRIDPAALARWKATGKGYQTRMAEMLARGPA